MVQWHRNSCSNQGLRALRKMAPEGHDIHDHFAQKISSASENFDATPGLWKRFCAKNRIYGRGQAGSEMVLYEKPYK
jgi:hypothetical protein